MTPGWSNGTNFKDENLFYLIGKREDPKLFRPRRLWLAVDKTNGLSFAGSGHDCRMFWGIENEWTHVSAPSTVR